MSILFWAFVAGVAGACLGDMVSLFLYRSSKLGQRLLGVIVFLVGGGAAGFLWYTNLKLSTWSPNLRDGHWTLDTPLQNDYLSRTVISLFAAGTALGLGWLLFPID